MASRTLILLACSLGPAAGVTRGLRRASSSLPSFASFVKTNGRDFQVGTVEYARRKEIYELRVTGIQRHNAQPNQRWTAGVNHLSDRTDAEFQQLLGWRHHHRSGSAAIGKSMLEVGTDVSHHDDVIDHRTNLSVAGDVPDQESCGSCWAVASTQTLKRHYKLKTGNDRVFSTQELVSCAKNPNNCGGTGGCEGSTVEIAYDYVMLNGLRNATEMPYNGTTGVCDKNITESDFGGLDPVDKTQLFATVGSPGTWASTLLGASSGITGYHTIQKNAYDALLTVLFDVGPVAVTVAASDWSTYSLGAFSRCNEAGADHTLNHAVVLMGIGKDGNDKTYIVQNSWGPTWGENGYIRLLRTNSEASNCHDDTKPKDGIACGPEAEMPSSVSVCGTCGILYDNVYLSWN